MCRPKIRQVNQHPDGSSFGLIGGGYTTIVYVQGYYSIPFWESLLVTSQQNCQGPKKKENGT